MDQGENINHKKLTGIKNPEIPIQTYKWEDVRRSRKKGGYPWTYLYKEAFNELVNPQDFTMDGLRKNKTSTASSASDSLDIKEITEDDIKGLENIDSSYVVIEGPILLGGETQTTKEQDIVIESAESSDNISQYLDKDDRGLEQIESTETLTVPGTSILSETEERQTERAKSEEPKRKRKLSIESNYSRISLSRLGLMKRLRDAKEKLTLPKFGLPPKPKKKDEPKKEIKTEVPKKQNKNEKPVYIHIPLKPPEGIMDEYSYLEFEEKQPKEQSQPIELPPSVQIEITEEEDEDKDNSTEVPNTEQVQVQNSLNLGLKNDQEDDVSAIIFLEGDDENDNKGDYDIMVVDIDEQSQEMTMSQVTNTEVRKQFLESIKKVESLSELNENNQNSNSNLSRTSSKTSKTSRGSLHKRRAKSVEPEKKRRSSIDSGHSRKSLSKIGLIKKIKQFHLPFQKSPSKKSLETPKKDVLPPQLKEIPKAHKMKEPVYIHIPLKPPPGESDEFSHLESGIAEKIEPETNETNETNEDKNNSIESPIDITPHPQFIFLTPPSDDEILDKPDVPETPSSETGSLFHFGEIKQIAKKAIDQVHGKLDSVNEEDIMKNPAEITIEEEKEVIDDEDGLKTTQKEEVQILKSNLKGGTSPLPKKKVSFKRKKPSQISKDDGYEEIESPSSDKNKKVDENVEVSTLEKSQSMSVDEEKSYLDTEKVIKSTSLEEDYNKWSKSSDHEYEPVNPPLDDSKERKLIKSHVSDVLNPSSSLNQYNSDDETQVSVQEMQTDIENRFFNKTISGTIDNEKRDIRKSPSRSRSRERETNKPNKFQTAIKESATKFKTKLQSIKKPNISLPSRPKFHKPNIKKPNISLPKLPDLTATFRKNSKPTVKKNTEEKEMTSKTEKIFDFSTYPRLFKKKKQDLDTGSLKEEKAETKKTEKIKRKENQSGPTETIRIPLHSEDSMDNGVYHQKNEVEKKLIDEKTSPPRYEEDIDAGDETYQIQNEKIFQLDYQTQDDENNQFDDGDIIIDETYQDGKIHEIITDLDQPEPEEIEQPLAPTRQKAKLQQNDSLDTNYSKDAGSSVSSLGYHRGGVIEEIDSDQFFLREKGISQDNIDMGKYLSTEIREAFKTPKNALDDMDIYKYEELSNSNQSLPETKKKSIRKPKRRKTPHASQERLRYEESENEDYNYNFMPPIRPRRKSKRRKRLEETQMLQRPEIIPVYHIEENEENFSRLYENDQMEGKEQPDIHVSGPYKNVLYVHDNIQRRASEPIPAAPPRKHKSLKSLNASERESIFDDYEIENENNNLNGYSNQETFMEMRNSNKNLEETQLPKPPTRSRSKTRSTSRCDSIFDRTDSIMYDEDREPIIEEPCIKDLRDAMGYAIVDKNQNKNWEHKFCTVPRSQCKDTKPPERPLRNYSTLGPSRPPRKLSRNMTDEEKENIDITQYIEIEDDRDLKSGEVIQKIQNRPLPAPPRPPRIKSKPLQEISYEPNDSIEREVSPEHQQSTENLDETEAFTQTEPLPADFVCEEVTQEETDKIMTPSAMRKNELNRHQEDVPLKKEKILITPNKYTYHEETITHGQLLVQPLNGSKILPDSQLSHERIIPVTSDEDETSEIPETFKQLSDPKLQENDILMEKEKSQKPPESEKLNIQKIQVSDMDVDRLTVNELIANKLVVSEIDSEKITTQEINAQSGTLKLNNIDLESGVVEKLLQKLQESSRQQSILDETKIEEDTKNEQKKTPIDFNIHETSTNIPVEKPAVVETQKCEISQLEEENSIQSSENIQEILQFENIESEISENVTENNETPPIRPQRNTEKKINNCEEKIDSSSHFEERIEPIETLRMREPEIDDEPPPRPPQPEIPYIPSQPPASFYALRAQQYVEGFSDDIPLIPRRKRHQRHITRSSSSESNEIAIPRRSRIRTPDPSISQLTGQLVSTCSIVARNTIKRLIEQVNNNISHYIDNDENEDGNRQNVQVIIVILLVLISGLLLLGYGDGRTVHLHHWEYFNPPKDI